MTERGTSDGGQPETPPLERLQRWEDHGAIWRATRVTGTEATVDLCACTGELVEQLRSSDPGLLAYLQTRPSSDVS